MLILGQHFLCFRGSNVKGGVQAIPEIVAAVVLAHTGTALPL